MYLSRSLQARMPFSLYLERRLVVLNNLCVTILGLKWGKPSCGVREDGSLSTINPKLHRSKLSVRLLGPCQHIFVLLLHILQRGCYVAWYYYHRFLVLLLKLFVSWSHRSALRSMMKVTTVGWPVWLFGSVCLCIFSIVQGGNPDFK